MTTNNQNEQIKGKQGLTVSSWSHTFPIFTFEVSRMRGWVELKQGEFKKKKQRRDFGYDISET